LKDDPKADIPEQVAGGDVNLSVVIVTRNEEEYIKKTLESVMSSLEGMDSAEVLLVDSNSRDRTVEIASAFPIRIVVYRSSFYSASAGRSVGLSESSGEFVLFLDGDHLLDERWLQYAVEELRKNPDIAVIAGKPESEESATSETGGHERSAGTDLIRDDRAEGRWMVTSSEVGGNALYRSFALREAGGFNPYLRGVEDIECSIRLRATGYRITRTGMQMGVHMRVNKLTLSSISRRIKRGFLLGRGQLIRTSLSRPRMLFYFIKRFLPYVLFGLWLVAGIICLALIPVVGSAFQLIIWACVALFVLPIYLATARCRKHIVYTLLNTAAGGIELLRGLFIPVADPGSFSPELEWVKGADGRRD
jgi:glycosyltransferase involved in cell wall biosynthesis